MKILLLLAAFAVLAPAQEPAPDVESKDLLDKVCGGCHPMALTTSRRGSRDDWEQTISKMIAKGLDAPEDDLYKVLDILTKFYGPKKEAPQLPINKAGPAEIAKFFGIAEADAAKIVKARETTGGFKSWEQVAKAATDPKKLESKKDQIVY